MTSERPGLWSALQMQGDKCPICGSPSPTRRSMKDLSWEIVCPRCGAYLIDDYAKDNIEKALELDDRGIVLYLRMNDAAP